MLNLKKRIKNLWKLSAIEFIPDGTHRRIPEYEISPTNVVQIIKRENPEEEFLKQTHE